MRFAYWGPATDPDEALAHLMQHHDYVAVDTETIGLKGQIMLQEEDDDGDLVKTPYDKRTCIGVGIAISPSEAFYFPLGEGRKWKNVPAVDTKPLLAKLQRQDETKILFNCMFDLERVLDAPLLKVDMAPYVDLSLMSRVQGLQNSLDAVCSWYLGVDHLSISDVLPKRKTMLDLTYPDTAYKCLWDVMDTYRAFMQMQGPKWEGNEAFTWRDYLGLSYDVSQGMLDCYHTDLKCTDLLRRMNHRGVKIHQDRVLYWHDRLSREMSLYERYFDFDPGNDIQFGTALAERGNWLPLTDTGRQMQVSEEIVKATGDPLALMVLQWRKRRKLRSTYISPFLDKDRFYTEFRLDLATGRLASSNRNIQNVPGENYQGLQPVGAYNMRDILEPDRAPQWSWMDLSQAEMRGFAYLTQDPTMLETYREGRSIHEDTMKALWPQLNKRDNPDIYTLCKTFNFAMIFDASVSTLVEQTGRPYKECERLRDDWLALRHVAHDWMLAQAATTRPWVENDYGRRMRIPDASYVTADHQRKCRINYPVQGLIADVVKRGMLLCDHDGLDTPIQAHDELVADDEADFPEALAHIHPLLEIPFESHKEKYWK